MMAPILGPINVASGVTKAFDTSTGPVSATSAARLGEPEAAEHTMTPAQEEKNRTRVMQGFNQATEGAFQTLAPLSLLDPASIGALPLYGIAADKGQKALQKAGLKPETSEMITNMALAFGPAIFHAARIHAPDDVIRDMAVGIGHQAVTEAMGDYPNFGNMTENAQARILQEKEMGIWTRMTNANMVDVAKFAKTMGLDPSELYDFVKPEETAEAPAPKPAGLPQAPPEEPEAKAQPAPETPPAPAEPSPQESSLAPTPSLTEEERGTAATPTQEREAPGASLQRDQDC